MKKVLLLILIFSYNSFNYGLHVTIIESQSLAKAHIMDERWNEVIKKLGHTADIREQSTLDDNQFFSGTDILIIASGTIVLSANRVNTILSFLKSGKPVYIQSEYQRSYTTNIAFDTIVSSLGGQFAWTKDFAGNLDMEITGPFQTSTSIMTYYWYSVSGAGDCNMIHFLKFKNEYHGFQYMPEDTAYGNIITTTDQDWVHTFNHPELMENIIKNLIDPKRNVQKKLKLINDTTICEGNTLLLDPLFTNATYIWQDLSRQPNLIVSKPGMYWVEVTTERCIMRDSVNVVYLPKPKADLGKDVILCNGYEMELNAGSPTLFYLWQDGSTQPTLKASKAGTYWVQASNICGVVRDSIVLNYDSLQNFELGNDTSLCEGNLLILTSKISNATYLWDNNSTNPLYTVDKTGEYWVTLSFGPCKISDTIHVNYIRTPGDAFENFTTLCQGKTLILNQNADQAIYVWQDNSTAPVFHVSEGGKYWVKTSNSCGSYTDTITVETKICDCYIFIPNAFTPDDNGLNDGFSPLVTTCEMIHYNFEVFNAWGERLFITNNAGTQWDGRYKGDIVPQGVYMYRLQVSLEDSSIKNFSGSFTLMY